MIYQRDFADEVKSRDLSLSLSPAIHGLHELQGSAYSQLRGWELGRMYSCLISHVAFLVLHASRQRFNGLGD